MREENRMKLLLLGVGGLALFVLVMIVLVVSSLFSSSPSPSPADDVSGTPTPIPDTITQADPRTRQFTPLQKTTIGTTTDDQIRQQTNVISSRRQGDVTIYLVESKEEGETDEIHTRNGVVIYEKTSTETNAAPLPRLSDITRQYGMPEETLDKVGDGFYMSAYLYPTKGFAIYANRYTGSIYEVQRFVPMSLAEYKVQYGVGLSPAPEMPKEGM